MKKRREKIEMEEPGAPILSMGEALGMETPAASAPPPEGKILPSTEGDEAQYPKPKTASSGTYRKAVLQRARAGGGKWVVRVLLTPTPDQVAQLDGLAREARRALGTGARGEEGALLIQGDIPDRVEAWLRRRGIEKIVR